MGIGYYAFITIMTTCFLIKRANSNSSRDRATEEKNFWAREQEANFARRKDISKLDYIKIPVDTLPIDRLYELKLSKYADELKRLSGVKVINLSDYTNTDLKLMYGPANLNELTTYDSNYTLLIRTLDNIGKELTEKEADHLAAAFLEYAVSIGSDITSTYVNLGNIYHSQNETDKLKKLIADAEEIKSLSGPTIVTKLNDIK